MNKSNLLEKYKKLAESEHLLAFKVSDFYNKKVNDEISKIGMKGPLFRSSYPTMDRLTIHSPFEVPDFVNDKDNMPSGLEGILIQKYPDRVLIISTDLCAGHCQYCFRTRLLSDEHASGQKTPLTDINIKKIIDYINKKKSVKEVIFSGGDPMMVPFAQLKKAILMIKNKTTIRSIRIHTRAIIYLPTVFTKEKIDFFAKQNIRLVFHINHPYEICNVVTQKILSLNRARVKMYNQFPILRKINDNSTVIVKLLETLDTLNVRTLSIFIPDPISFSASFRISLRRIFSIFDDINWHTPSWINSVRVVLDSPIGKIRRENICGWDHKNGIITFARDNKKVIYHDFPEDMDEPGELKYLLWKGDYEK